MSEYRICDKCGQPWPRSRETDRNEEWSNIERNSTSTQVTSYIQGLNNKGQISYINSTIQCLGNLPVFKRAILEEGRSTQSVIIHRLSKLFKALENDPESVDQWHKQFLESISTLYRKYEQQDLYEFMAKFFNVLNEEMSYKIIDKLLTGLKTTNFKCYNCRNVHSTRENFVFLVLPSVESSYFSYRTDLTDLLNKLITSSNTVKFNCRRCDAQTMNTITTSFERLPQVLIIRLKSTSRDTTKVKYDKNLDMSRYSADSDAKYRLTSVIEYHRYDHSGHYTVSCEAADGNWYRFNDREIHKINDIVNDEAYLLFYSRIN